MQLDPIIPLLVATILALALFGLLMRVARQPLLIGYVLTGFVIGPAVFGLITDLEMMSRLWKGQTGVDLALLGGCSQFVESCCVQALDFRWGGDVHPYNQPLGLYPSVILCAVTGGLFAPSFIEFRKVPRAEAGRSPGQRTPIRHVNFADVDAANDSASDWDVAGKYEVLFSNLQKAMSDR